MTKVILDIWSAINKGLTVLNSFIMIILFQITIPEKDRKGKEVKVPIASFRYSYYTLLHGIIHHDLYHTGQIMLIKKSLQTQPV